MKKSFKSALIASLKFSVAGVIIYCLLNRGVLDLEAFNIVFSSKLFPLCIILIGLNTLVLNSRWWVILKELDIDLSFFKSLLYYLLGLFFNFAVPGSISGDIIKSFYLTKRRKLKHKKAYLSVAVDRFFGLFVILLLSIIALGTELLSNKESENLFSLWIGLLVLLILFALLGFSSFCQNRLRFIAKFLSKSMILKCKNFYELFKDILSRKSLLLKSLASSLLSQILAILLFALVAHILGESIPVLAFFFTVPLAFIIMALPITPAGIGVGQLAIFELLKIYTGSEFQAGGVGLSVLQGIQFFYSLIGLGFLLLIKKEV